MIDSIVLLPNLETAKVVHIESGELYLDNRTQVKISRDAVRLLVASNTEAFPEKSTVTVREPMVSEVSPVFAEGMKAFIGKKYSVDRAYGTYVKLLNFNWRSSWLEQEPFHALTETKKVVDRLLADVF